VWFRGQLAHLGERFVLHLLKRDDHIGHLHARIVDVVLHGDVASCVPKQANHGVSKDRVAQMPDVRGLIGIDAGVLNNDSARYVPD